MNSLDIVIGIILILFALSGFRKGLIVEAFYLASFLVGIYGAMFFSGAMAEWLSEAINVSTEYLSLISFILTFILVIIIVRYLGRLISNLVETMSLGFIDKIGGFVFGALKGALLVSVFIMILNIFNVSNMINKELREDSFLYSHTEQIANILYKNQDLIKDSIERSFNKGLDVFEEGIDKFEDIIE